jgi:hypothetical protein
MRDIRTGTHSMSALPKRPSEPLNKPVRGTNKPRHGPPRGWAGLGCEHQRNCVLYISGFLSREANRLRRCLMASFRSQPSS